MRSLHVLTLLASLTAFAADPVPNAPPVVRENQPPPLARPKPPRTNKGAKVFVQRRLARPFAGEGTPIIFSVVEKPALRPMTATRGFEFEPGVALESAWPDAKTAWLVRDLNGDGVITSGRELFGSFTVLSNGTRAKNGFEALADLPADASLRLWFDRDGDRRVSQGELEAVPFVVPTTFEVVEQCDAAGNCVRERSRVEGGWLLDLHLRLVPSRS